MGMANLIYHAGTAGKIKQKEVTRAVCHTFRKTKGVFKNHGNEDIDNSLTKYNIDYEIPGYEGKTPDEIVKERIENEYRGKREIRKDAVILREVIANPSADMFVGMTIEEKQKTINKFIKDALPWFQKEFGKKNVVGISGHLDETNPHVHFAIMPMTDDGRISQKDFFKGPGDLKRQHREFREHMRSKAWMIAEENKYEDIDDFDLPTYKANAKAINAKREEQKKAMSELLANDKDLRQAAFDKAVEEFMGLGSAVMHKLMREELEQKKKDIETERVKMQMEVDKEWFEATAERDKLRHMIELRQREDERKLKEQPAPSELNKILANETDGRFGIAVSNKTGEVVLVTLGDKGKPKRRITEETLVRSLTTKEPDGNGGVFLDLSGNEAISYVLGHYGSDKPKTKTEAQMDGLRAISSVHQQMALELQNQKQR